MRPNKFRFGFKVGNGVLFKFMSIDEMLECDFPLENMIESINESFGDTHAEDVTEFECISKDQFTGLTDKNGVDIYEGDIVKDDMGYNRLITIDSFGVDAEGYDSGDHYFGQVPDTFPWAKFEVIGNEHQSPELMESK